MVIVLQNLKIAMICSFFIIATVYSCDNNDFDKQRAEKLITLNNEDISNYSVLHKIIINDLATIRSMSKSIDYSIDTTFCITNTHYLYQINRRKYEPIIKQLENRNIFSDNILCSYNGTVVFRLKTTTNYKWNESNESHIHELVFKSKVDDFSLGDFKVKVDSLLNEDIRYVYFVANTGH